MKNRNTPTIVFDLGGVLIDWNPCYLYRKIIPTEAEMEYFLGNICTPEWNEQQDAGRSFAEGVALLQARYPGYADWINAYDDRWDEMVGEANPAVVQILRQVCDEYGPVYALTNWSTEKFPVARERFEFLQWLAGIIVSGEENLKKPDPKIYHLLEKRFELDPANTVFIDDSPKNVAGARVAGYQAIHFTSAKQLRGDLLGLGIEIEN